MAPERLASVPLIVQDYTVLPLSCPPVPSYPQATTHYLYLRQNAPKVPTETTPRELFLVNLPIDSTDVHLRSLFSEQLGGARVEQVAFEDARVQSKTKVTAPVAGRKRKRGRGTGQDDAGTLPDVWDRELHRSGSTAVVTLVDASSAELALKEARKLAKAGKQIVWGKGTEGRVSALGSARYTEHHKMRYPDPAKLQMSVDAFMTAFAEQETTRQRSFARQRQEPDEDGFITVTRGGRVGPARLEEAQEKMEKQKERQKGKEDFYRFQMREKRKERAAGLLKGFDEDRRRVAEMKKKRNKFRPV